jgi:hypothetical protein
MKNKHTFRIAAAGVALLAAVQGHASTPSNLVYHDNDLLLNFRDSVDNDGADATFDVGNVNTFVSTVYGLSGHTAVLDSGSGYATSGYPVQFSGATLINDVSQSIQGSGDGTADDIGFSAAAEDLTASGNADNTIWLTRQITASQLTAGGAPNTQQNDVAQNGTATRIQEVGFGAEPYPTGAGLQFAGALDGALVSGADSYYAIAQDLAGNIDYYGYQNPIYPGVIEATPSSATVYEALWEVPQSGNGPATYLGYFTFQATGELDFTCAGVITVPALSIVLSGGNVIVSWPDTGSFTLQQNSNLSATNSWTASGGTVTTANGTNSVTFAAPSGDLFFRLHNP